MKSVITLKSLSGLVGAVAISSVVWVRMSQTDFPAVLQEGELTRGTRLEQSQPLGLKRENQRSLRGVQNPSLHNLSSSHLINHPVDDAHHTIRCNLKFSACPVPY